MANTQAAYHQFHSIWQLFFDHGETFLRLVVYPHVDPAKSHRQGHHDTHGHGCSRSDRQSEIRHDRQGAHYANQLRWRESNICLLGLFRKQRIERELGPVYMLVHLLAELFENFLSVAALLKHLEASIHLGIQADRFAENGEVYPLHHDENCHEDKAIDDRFCADLHGSSPRWVRKWRRAGRSPTA